MSDTLSDCPDCGGSDFVRASLFSAANLASTRASASSAPSSPAPLLTASGETTIGRSTPGVLGGVLSQHEPIDDEAWLRDARSQIGTPGEYLAYEESGGLKLVALTREWTRIGRSLAADVRFDDPTVSRRHALVVRQADGVRVLDDRSLNGVFVNGSRIEWKVLQDGDEILVGRYRLRFLSVLSDVTGAPEAATPAAQRDAS